MSLRIAPANLASQYDSGVTIAELARLNRCDPDSIRAHLRRYGVTIRPRRVADRSEILAAHASGLSYRAIGRLVGVSGQAVWKILNASKSTSKGA